jgi:thiol-disulfide isomerase/thioredoxin
LKARIKRRERNRRLLIVTALVVVVAIVIVGAYALSTVQSPNSSFVGQPVSSKVYQLLSTTAQSSYGNTNTSLLSQLKNFNGQPYTSGGKPIVVYIGADYCPYCAYQRWAIVVALMRFGNFTNLRYMLSSSTDVFPNSPTFTFYQSSYSSKYIVFQGYEEQDRSQNPLQPAPSNYSAVFGQFGSSYPFIDIGNKYVVSGAFEFPTLMDGKNWTQIAQEISGTNPLSNEVIDSANVITAAICKVDGGSPSSVCSRASISGLSVTLTAYDYSAKTSFAAGMISEIPSAWARVQYGQIAWTTKSSMKMRYPSPTTASAQSGISA